MNRLFFRPDQAGMTKTDAAMEVNTKTQTRPITTYPSTQLSHQKKKSMNDAIMHPINIC